MRNRSKVYLSVHAAIISSVFCFASCNKKKSESSTSSTEGLAIDVTSGFAKSNEKLAIAVPEIGEDSGVDINSFVTGGEGSLNLAKSAGIWSADENVYPEGVGGSPKNFVFYSFSTDDNSAYGTFKKKFNVSCAVLSILETDEDGLLKVGDYEIIEDAEFEAKVKEKCPDLDFDLAEEEETTTSLITVTKPEETVYDRKVVIKTKGEDDHSETIYVKFRENILRFSSWEDNSKVDGKFNLSASIFEYDGTKKTFNFQYYSKSFPAIASESNFSLYRLTVDESVENKPTHFAIYDYQNSIEYGFAAAYLADVASNAALSLFSTQPETDISDANACVSLSKLEIKTDDSQDCEVAGFLGSDYQAVASAYRKAWVETDDVKPDGGTEVPFRSLDALLGK